MKTRMAVAVLGLLACGISYLYYDSEQNYRCASKALDIALVMAANPDMPIASQVQPDGSVLVRIGDSTPYFAVYPEHCVSRSADFG